MSIREELANGNYLLFDGGMGTMLQAAGLTPGTLPEEWNLTHPEEILKVHRAYVEAGSDVITTNTFGANSLKYKEPVVEVIAAAVAIARRSGARYVAQDLGPTGLMLRPLGEASFDEAYELYKEQVLAGVEAGSDLFIIETMTDLLETKAAVLAVKENSQLPVIASMSYEASGRTFLGTSAAAAAITLCGLGVDAVGVNCSLGPDQLEEIAEEICRYSTVPVIMQANAGLPVVKDGKTVFTVEPQEYCNDVRNILQSCRDKGLDKIRLLGGCCGTNPEYITGLRAIVDELEPAKLNFDSEGDLSGHALVCSSSMVVDYDGRTAVIGERLNPTGKKKISSALRESNYDLLIAEGLEQQKCGAQILDVNAGLPDINETAVLENLVTGLQGACSLPLQIDTTDAAALERAVRIYSGKPIINSVNGKAAVMDEVMPIAAKYGAALVCLTLDESGIPSKAEDRLAIAEKIMKRADEYGIPRKNLIIDGLTMTVSTNQAEAKETLKTVGLVRSRLGLHTCLGVSNISFGLPNREIMNSVFLAEAFTCGLNLPIIDPTKERYMQAVYSHRVLSGEDVGATGYIEYSVAHPIATIGNGGNPQSAGGNLLSALGGNVNGENGAATASLGDRTTGNIGPATGGYDSVANIVIEGNKYKIESKTRELLESRSVMDIINNEFIPALDKVGELYEQGRIFLPQLMSSAETAKRGFDILKESGNASEENSAGSEKRSIVLATVQGDIHDIGKNIVKMLLENYGYDVIDLGKDVPATEIVQAVKSGNAPLVGLSALMTTTVHSMEETISVLKRECPDCKIVVGGAVLTEDLARKIGADFYAKDAAETAKIAGEVFGR